MNKIFKSDAMKKIILIIMCLTLLFAGCSPKKLNANISGNKNLSAEKSEESEIEFTSKIKSDECMLCGDADKTLLPLYKGQINVGIIDLNTFDVCNLKMNRYDDYGNLIEEKARSSSTMINERANPPAMLGRIV